MLRFFGLGVALATLLVTGAKAQFDSVLFTEDFNGVTLLDSVNERLGTVLVTREASDLDSTPIAGVFSPTAPGWTVDNTLASFGGVPTIGNAGIPGAGVADYGVDEWEGWSFVNKDFWVAAAGEQDRELFSGASGSVAVVDPDEYFDLGGPSDETNGGYYNSSLKSAPIAVSAGLYSLSWVDSWRDEAFDDDHPSGLVGQNNQSIEVLAVFDVGAPATVASFNSDSADLANFRDDDPDGTQTQGFVVPAGATTVSLQFNIANAGNDWWYAIDNIDLSQVDLVGGGPNVSVWSEDFEGVTLGDSVNEREAFAKTTTESATPETVARPNSFTHTAPGGWTVDNSGLPNGVADDDNGVFEFEGWTFVSGDFWTFAEESGREEFTKGTGAFAVADSDEYDDLGPANANGPLDTILISPEMDITGVEEGRLALAFDSSWRPEGNQQALIEVNFGEGWIEALNWSSDDTLANFHDRNTNESVLQLLNNPAGATTAQVRFSYLGGSNNWFWAIDNVQVGVATVPEPSSVATLCLAALAAAGARRQRR